MTNRGWTPETYPVRVVVTGMEHSGTTILMLLLQQHPKLDSAFECGFLLAESPAHFKHVHPWYEWMQEPLSKGQWGVRPEHMDHICTARNWPEMYRRLVRYSPVFNRGEQQQVCDKTPRYLKYLDTVLTKLPDFVPCLVIEKDIEGLWLSHRKRYGAEHLDEFAENFTQYYKGLKRGLTQHGSRIHRVKYETLCTDLETQLHRIFSLLGLECRSEFISSRQDDIREYYFRSREQIHTLPDEERKRLQQVQRQLDEICPPPGIPDIPGPVRA
jgi:hypothetical protein